MVWVSASQKIPLFVLARNPHKDLRTRFPTKPEKDEGRQCPGAVNRRKQLTEESSQQKWGEGDGWRKAAAQRGARTCRPRNRVGQRERVNYRSWRLCGKFARIHARDSPWMHIRLQKGAQISPFLRLELTQVRACLFFFLPLTVVYVVSCVFVNQCEMPLAEMRETTRRLDGHELV